MRNASMQEIMMQRQLLISNTVGIFLYKFHRREDRPRTRHGKILNFVQCRRLFTSNLTLNSLIAIIFQETLPNSIQLLNRPFVLLLLSDIVT